MEISRNEKISFILNAVIYTLCAIFAYKNYAFKTIGGLSYTTSEIIFYAIFIPFVLFGTLFWLNKPKTFFTQYVNIIIPVGIYTTISYFQDIWLLAVLVGVIVTAMNVFIFMIIRYSKPKNAVLTRKAVIKRKARAFGAIQNVSAMGFTVIALPILLSSLLFRSVYGPFERHISPWQDIVNVDESNIKLLKAFADEDEWKSLDRYKKTEALQVMANIYASENGIPHELIVSLLGLNRVTIAGYHARTYTISFNNSYFNSMSAKEALNTLMHECTHAYQYCYVDALKNVDEKYYNMSIMQKALVYDDEFSHYINGYFDYDGYYSQWCETTARESADILTEMYLEQIENYMDL